MWLVALCLYALVGALDMAVRLEAGRRAGLEWFAADHLVVAFSAGLFWPLDLVARGLLAR